MDAMSAKSVETHPLLVSYRDAIARYDELAAMEPDRDLTANVLAGRRAGAVRAIRQISLEMELSDPPVAYDEWTPPTKVYAAKPSRSDEELIQRLAKVEALRDNPAKSTSVRNTADREARKLRATAIGRGLIESDTEEETPAPNGKTPADALDAVESTLAAKVA